MEDKIEIGDYIRNKEGYIGQVRLILFEELENQKFYICEKDNDLSGGYKKDIIKHSKNIVDLIEVGDYVNGYKVINVINGENVSSCGKCVDIDSSMDSSLCTFWDDDIKDVVTKELFEKQKYKLGG